MKIKNIFIISLYLEHNFSILIIHAQLIKNNQNNKILYIFKC